MEIFASTLCIRPESITVSLGLPYRVTLMNSSSIAEPVWALSRTRPISSPMVLIREPRLL